MTNRICSVEGCEAKHYGRGFCKPHYRRDYYQRNGDRERANFKAWRDERVEDERQRARDYYAEHPDYFAAKYLRNRETIREWYREQSRQNPGRGTAANREWRKANPERWALRNRENQRRRRGGEKVDYALILTDHGMVCHLCGGGIASLADLHFDHVIPLAKGGPHSRENIKPAHALCNMRKGDKLI